MVALPLAWSSCSQACVRLMLMSHVPHCAMLCLVVVGSGTQMWVLYTKVLRAGGFRSCQQSEYWYISTWQCAV